MGEPPCDSLRIEMALDLLEGEIAAELPAHMRAFARSHAEGRPPPPAPLITRLPSTLETARTACRDELTYDRGLALLRLVAPLVIEDDPAVVAARSETPSWEGLQRLAAARDAVAEARFGMRHIAMMHRLHGAAASRELDAPGPAVDGWQAREGALDHAAIVDAWNAVAARLGINGNVRVDRSAKAQPRAFVIDPKLEVIVVVPSAIDTPAARFAVLHELGHAVVALAMSPGVPRAVDEAAASYVARFAEPPSWLPPKWPSELAVAARARRLRIAAMLDDIERRLPELADVPGAAPPWALWHDPGAQACYVAAEEIADRMRDDLGPNPPRGQVVRALIAERDRIDQRAL